MDARPRIWLTHERGLRQQIPSRESAGGRGSARVGANAAGTYDLLLTAAKSRRAGDDSPAYSTGQLALPSRAGLAGNRALVRVGLPLSLRPSRDRSIGSGKPTPPALVCTQESPRLRSESCCPVAQWLSQHRLVQSTEVLAILDKRPRDERAWQRSPSGIKPRCRLRDPPGDVVLPALARDTWAAWFFGRASRLRHCCRPPNHPWR